MYKIGLVTSKYQISHRALRYWEEVGILKSIRRENKYRYYDESNLNRIKQIVFFRKLNLPIKDIESIFKNDDLSNTVDILKRHLQDIKNQEETYKLLSHTLKYLIKMMEEKKHISDMSIDLDKLYNNPLEIIKNSSDDIFIKGVDLMNDEVRSRNDLRIINLPKMIVASISFSGENPEDLCWINMKQLIDDYQLDRMVGFRNLGFGYQDESGNYSYELWVTIPEDFSLPKPFTRKVFPGGLYGALPANLANIGERWNELHDLVLESDSYIHDTSPNRFGHYLEECLDIDSFHDSKAKISERQLDLLLPIKKVDSKIKDDGIKNPIIPIEVRLRKITLVGTYFKYENTLPWKKSIPWYKLAQFIYKVGDGYQECIFEGNNTYSIIFGESRSNDIFYLDKKNSTVSEIFGAVELIKPFPFYPDELHEYVLEECRYLVFASKIDPMDTKSKKLSLKPLYDSAREYLKGKEQIVNPNYCIERDYRSDGRYVDKIELYIPLK